MDSEPRNPARVSLRHLRASHTANQHLPPPPHSHMHTIPSTLTNNSPESHPHRSSNQDLPNKGPSIQANRVRPRHRQGSRRHGTVRAKSHRIAEKQQGQESQKAGEEKSKSAPFPQVELLAVRYLDGEQRHSIQRARMSMMGNSFADLC